MTMRPLTIVLVLFAVSLAMMAGVPSWRQAARNTIIPDQRKIVAKIQGTISETGPHLVIFKVKTRDQFFLEVYRSIDSIELIQRIALEEAADGRFEYQGRFTNLALADMDMDGTYEIVSPMYDKNGSPRLLIFKFNSTLQSFEKLTAD